MSIERKQPRNNAQIALGDWHTNIARHPHCHDPNFYGDMIRGVKQMAAILSQLKHEGYEYFYPISLRQLRGAVRSCRDKFDLAIVFNDRHYRKNYKFRSHKSTLDALKFGRWIVIIQLRLAAIEHEVEGRFHMVNHLEEVEKWAEHLVYSVAYSVGQVNCEQIGLVFEEGVSA